MMARYRAKYGTIYDLSGSTEDALLSVVTTSTKMVRGKEVTTEKKQTYLRADKRSCFAYMLEVDEFDPIPTLS